MSGRRQAIIKIDNSDSRNKLQWNITRNSHIFIKNCIWKCRLRIGGHFVRPQCVKHAIVVVRPVLALRNMLLGSCGGSEMKKKFALVIKSKARLRHVRKTDNVVRTQPGFVGRPVWHGTCRVMSCDVVWVCITNLRNFVLKAKRVCVTQSVL